GVNELFLRRVEASASRPSYRVYRQGRWTEVTWSEMGREVEEVAQGLLALGVEKGQAIAILGETRPEWGASDLAVLAAGGRSVGVYQGKTAAPGEPRLRDPARRCGFVEKPGPPHKGPPHRPRSPTPGDASR